MATLPPLDVSAEDRAVLEGRVRAHTPGSRPTPTASGPTTVADRVGNRMSADTVGNILAGLDLKAVTAPPV